MLISALTPQLPLTLTPTVTLTLAQTLTLTLTPHQRPALGGRRTGLQAPR